MGKIQCILPLVVVLTKQCDFCGEVARLEYLVTAANGVDFQICSSCRAKTLDTLGVSQHGAEHTIWLDENGAVV